jgi:hypothetical protein
MINNLLSLMKTSSILSLTFLSFFSCTEYDSEKNSIIQEVLRTSKEYGFKAEVAQGQGLDIGDLENYKGFLKFIKNPTESENQWVADQIFSNIDKSNFEKNQFVTESTENLSPENLKILCLQNSHLVNARLPIIYGGPFPSYENGGGLGVNFQLNIQNASLVSHQAYTYGIVPFTGVVGDDVILQNISGNEYRFFATYALSYNIVVDGITFYVTEPRYVTIRVEACTGAVTVNVAIP